MTRFAPVSAVVPVFGSAATLRALHRRLNAVLAAECADHEIVFVEDAGPDDAWRVIEALALEDGGVRGVRLARNAGQHDALLCGVRAARFPVVVTLDDDLQHPPEALPALLAALGDDVDVVYGRPTTGAHSRVRNLASKAFKAGVARLLAAPQVADISAFRAFRTALRDGFADHEGPSESLDALLARSTDRFAAVDVAHAPRRHGRSGYGVAKLARHALLVWHGFAGGASRRPARPGAVAAPRPLYEIRDTVGLRGGASSARVGEGEAAAVELRPLGPRDAVRMFRWMHDPTVSRNIGLTKTPSLAYTEAWIAGAGDEARRWARAVLWRGVHVGNVVLEGTGDPAAGARLSIYLGERDARGRGVGRAALRRTLAAGFGELGLERIWLLVLPWNEEAVRLYTRLGFQPFAGDETAAIPPGSLGMLLPRPSPAPARAPIGAAAPAAPVLGT